MTTRPYPTIPLRYRPLFQSYSRWLLFLFFLRSLRRQSKAVRRIAGWQLRCARVERSGVAFGMLSKSGCYLRGRSLRWRILRALAKIAATFSCDAKSSIQSPTATGIHVSGNVGNPEVISVNTPTGRVDCIGLPACLRGRHGGRGSKPPYPTPERQY